MRCWPGVVLSLVLIDTFAPRASSKPTLTLNRSGCFRLLMLADMHYGEGEAAGWGPEQDANTTRVQNHVLAAESPNLVVMLGDMITGNNVNSNASAYWNEFTAPVRTNFSMPWTTVLGNHDDYALQPFTTGGTSRAGIHTKPGSVPKIRARHLTAVDRRTLLGYDLEFANSLTQLGPTSISLVSNYFLPVYGNDQEQHQQQPASPALLLYFLDTGGGRSPELVFPDQVAWLKETRLAHIEKWGANITALLFMHIPCAQYSEALGSKEGFFGMASDGITPTANDTGLFDVVKSTGMTATFVGHDHGNDFCGKVQGVWLCYGRHSGYGGYGSWRRGSRVLEFCTATATPERGFQQSPTPTLETWVRLEDGEQIDSGKLL
jgi:hypothetical protein